MFKQVVAVGMNKEGRFKVDKDILSIKDVPFLRYRFTRFGEAEIAFMKECQSKFVNSVHLAEISITDEVTAAVEDFNSITQNLQNIAVFLYVDVSDNDVASVTIDESKLDTIDAIVKTGAVQRLCIRDRSTTLNAESFSHLVKMFISRLNVKEEFIGVCESPLSFDTRACLTAEKARELMAIFISNAEDVVPVSANHQCMECCNCIRYKLVTSDLIEVQAPPSMTKKEKSETDEDKPEAPKKKKLAFKALPNYRNMSFKN